MDPLDFLFSLERLGMKFGLETMQEVCAALGHPERAFSAVIVGGTNGKGSVTAMTSAALHAAGHRTARYTSPHLVRVEERFVIGEEEVDTSVLRDAAAVVQRAAEALVRDGTLAALPTFFECATAIAFELFRRAGVGIAVLEVGLGGRLDATNVVSPMAAAITSIAFDHQAQLGNDLASIAREKAGIIKPSIPVVCGPLPPPAERVVSDVCRQRGATLIHAMETARPEWRMDGRDTIVSFSPASWELTDIRLGLPGFHQVANAAVAVALLEQLSALGLPLSAGAVAQGLSAPRWPARLEHLVLHDGAEVLLDAAHNPAGAAALAAYLDDIGWRGATLVCGIMRDKDVDGILKPLLPFFARIICTTPPTQRALPAADLAARARASGAADSAVEAIEDPAAAVRAATVPGSQTVVAGSIFLVGPVRDILR
jgi:dihydrofolate synthase/folylpolyglutamate synthase